MGARALRLEPTFRTARAGLSHCITSQIIAAPESSQPAHPILTVHVRGVYLEYGKLPLHSKAGYA